MSRGIRARRMQWFYRQKRFSIGYCRGWRDWTGCCRNDKVDQRPGNADRTDARCESSPALISADLPALIINDRWITIITHHRYGHIL